MPTRTAHTAWTGTLQEGSGTVDLVSSGAGSYEVSFPKRAAEEAGGTTSPEELIGAATRRASRCSSRPSSPRPAARRCRST